MEERDILMGLTLGAWMLHEGRPVKLSGITEDTVTYMTALHEITASKSELEPIQITESILVSHGIYPDMKTLKTTSRKVFVGAGEFIRLEQVKKEPPRNWRVQIQDENGDTVTCAYIGYMHQLQAELTNQGMNGEFNGIPSLFQKTEKKQAKANPVTEKDIEKMVRMIQEETEKQQTEQKTPLLIHIKSNWN